MKYTEVCSIYSLDGMDYRQEKEDYIRPRAGYILSPTDYCTSGSRYIRVQSDYNPGQKVYRRALKRTF